MTTTPHRAAGRGALAGLASASLLLAVASTLARVAGRGSNPLLAVADVVVLLSPPALTSFAISTFGSYDKLVLLVGIGVVVAALAAASGALATRRLAVGLVPPAAFVAAALAAVLTGPNGGGPLALLPTLLATVVGAAAFVVLVRLARRPGRAGRSSAVTHGAAAERGSTATAGTPRTTPTTSRRLFLGATGGVVVAAGAVAAAGRGLGGGVRDAVASRSRLVLPAPTEPVGPVPVGAQVGPVPFRTPNADFYRVDTALSVPRFAAEDWVLRVSGMVDRPVELTWADLVALEVVEREVTLVCVSNEVGGELSGNAVWRGVRLSDVLELAGIGPDADMLLSTSVDGWTASTPLEAVVGNDDALLAFGMNGEPLPFEHGFPLRMVVPGLYGYVSATKWVSGLELTRFDTDQAYWSTRGYAERAPVKLSSRIDVPGSFARLGAGRNAVAGTAWAPGTGIDRVEVQVDDGAWQPAQLGDVLSSTTWRQWSWAWDAAPGSHTLRVRAVDADGDLQVQERAPIAPDGSTGWHSVAVTVT